MKAIKTKTSAVRCAIYTRKSTEEGLEQEFNSLDAQRESAEAYVKSQAHAGWKCLPERYEDGGYTGGNMDRPALRRLIADIESQKIDCVLVYKVDRLSRSLLDFARMMEIFEKHQISFVSITQQFNTATSMGRLVLNVLLSFAQFEREIISERTRDKIAATRRKGKWAGGMPLLGYDVDPTAKKLEVNPEEAVRVRAIFALFLEQESLQETLDAINQRQWLNKRWLTRKGRERGGRAFSRVRLRQLLGNPVYLGKVRYKKEVHAGEHKAIVDPETWNRVQAILAENRERGRCAASRHPSAALLQGLVRCTACQCTMTPSYAMTRGKRYAYYLCTAASKRGWASCPSKALAAGKIEHLVVERIRRIGSDPAVGRQILAQFEQFTHERIAQRQAEERELNGELEQIDRDMKKARTAKGSQSEERLADLQEQARAIGCRIESVHDDVTALRQQLTDAPGAIQTSGKLDPLWDTMSHEQYGRLIRMLVERVDYDGRTRKVVLAFHPAGIVRAAAELTCLAKEISK
jgi:site-specific DNA recombinase